MKIYIGESKLHGKGLFAARDIKKGEIVFIIKGKKIKFLIDSEAQAEKAGMNWMGYEKNVWVDRSQYCQFLNHSCDANMGIKGHVTLVAQRPIKKGEEVTCDYSFNEADIFWSMKCVCNSSSCRRIIKSIEFLPEDFVKKNQNRIPKYYQRVYSKFRRNLFSNFDDLKKAWISFIRS